MAVLTADSFGDLRASTRPEEFKGRFTEIATSLQRYTFWTEMLNKHRLMTQGGRSVEWRVQVRHAGSAKNVGIGQPDEVEIVDTMVVATADWRQTTANYAYFKEEYDMNRGDARIADIDKERQVSCMIDLAEKMEYNLWGPPVAIDDGVTPWGINTWVVKNATEGFNGGAPTGYTTIGLNPTTYPRWKNWTFQYAAVTQDDFIDKVKRAVRKTDFQTPVKYPDTGSGDDLSNKFYTNEPVISALEKYLQNSNQNLGNDLAKYQNAVVLMRSPVNWCPALDADTTNPIYGIDWKYFKTMILSGWWMKPTTVDPYPYQHTAVAKFKDSRYQWVMLNRRSSFVGATGVTYPA